MIYDFQPRKTKENEVFDAKFGTCFSCMVKIKQIINIHCNYINKSEKPLSNQGQIANLR